MQILRLHDPTRRPAAWTEIIRAGQFAAFAKLGESGSPCDANAARFSDPGAVTCAIFDSFAEARAFCEGAVDRHPALHFDIFDADGRARPPLLTVVHPAQAARLETSPWQARRRQVSAWILIGAGVPLMVFAYVEAGERDIFLIAFFGINMVLIGARLLWMNLALRETERNRETRMAQAVRGGRQDS